MIEPEKFYSSGDVEKLKIMTANNKDTRRQMLLRKIKSGEIEAVNVSTEARPRYVIQGKNLIKYLDKRVKNYKTK